MLIDHTNYYATTGGHGACRGCGEVTAIRLVTSMSRALGDERRVAHVAELEELIEKLQAKQDSLDATDTERHARIGRVLVELDKALYLSEAGPTGGGPAPTVVANATGCSSVYASTMPFTPYLDPWVNSLFQDAQPLASGIYEGISTAQVPEIKAMRQARLELEDAFDPEVDGKELRTLAWHHFTPEERTLMPNVLTIGGDGASYDIGFGAMSRVLASGTPIKMLVLNTGAYSNTGGQASTASFIGQDSDLSRVGKAHTGKHEGRKDLALLASFHPGVFASRDVDGHARSLPDDGDADARLPAGRGGDGHLHPVRHRERHRRGPVQLPFATRGREPDEPTVRARPEQGHDAARAVLARGQPRHRQDVDHQHARVHRRQR